MFCKDCGKELEGKVRFCPYCGKNQTLQTNTGTKLAKTKGNAVKPEEEHPKAEINLIEINRYEGQERSFPFLGETLTIPKEVDAFIYYRKAFKHNARELRKGVINDYAYDVQDLNQFFINFPKMYISYRNPLIDAAVKLLISYDIFDISKEEFEQGHNADFSRCNQTYQTLVTAFNATIENNQKRIIQGFNMLPIPVISGIGGFFAVTALNIATQTAFEASIRGANVNMAQRRELFNRINTDILFNDVFLDYWNVHYSFAGRLKQRGFDIWYPTEENNRKAEGLMDNLKNNLVPEDKIVPVLLQIFQARPQQEGLFEYLNGRFAHSDIWQIDDYFDYDGDV